MDLTISCEFFSLKVTTRHIHTFIHRKYSGLDQIIAFSLVDKEVRDKPVTHTNSRLD